MKTILINRHAKTNQAVRGQQDFDRELTERGISDSTMMANRLKGRAIVIDKVVSSTAKRAIRTCVLFGDVLGWKIDDVEQTRYIYENGRSAVLGIAEQLDDNVDTVIFFGHNPDFSELVTYFTGIAGIGLPTCGIVCIDFDTNQWKDVLNLNGVIRFSDVPKLV